jgi:hypothetical protein
MVIIITGPEEVTGGGSFFTTVLSAAVVSVVLSSPELQELRNSIPAATNTVAKNLTCFIDLNFFGLRDKKWRGTEEAYRRCGRPK